MGEPSLLDEVERQRLYNSNAHHIDDRQRCVTSGVCEEDGDEASVGGGEEWWMDEASERLG
jgi:hypothetical protein